MFWFGYYAGLWFSLADVMCFVYDIGVLIFGFVGVYACRPVCAWVLVLLVGCVFDVLLWYLFIWLFWCRFCGVCCGRGFLCGLPFGVCLRCFLVWWVSVM